MKNEHETPADASALPSLDDLQNRLLHHAAQLERLFGYWTEKGDKWGRDYYVMAMKAHSQFRLSLDHLQKIETAKQLQHSKLSKSTTGLLKADE